MSELKTSMAGSHNTSLSISTTKHYSLSSKAVLLGNDIGDKINFFHIVRVSMNYQYRDKDIQYERITQDHVPGWIYLSS